jgi:hypothetical protein
VHSTYVLRENGNLVVGNIQVEEILQRANKVGEKREGVLSQNECFQFGQLPQLFGNNGKTVPANVQIGEVG